MLKSFCLYSLYPSIFAILENKTEKKFKYSKISLLHANINNMFKKIAVFPKTEKRFVGNGIVLHFQLLFETRSEKTTNAFVLL